ncbi:NTP transferase domain-containing protein [bacterium]|nr:NTP transferase domain-containing protein [bacterium]
MRAIILVAGASRRMGSITDTTHKTLLDVGGKPILHRMMTSLEEVGIHDGVFVYGYMGDKVREYVEQQFPEWSCEWIENPDYAETNTAYSVRLTREAVLARDEDVLLLNGDVVLDARPLERTLEANGSTALAVRYGEMGEEEVKVRLDDTNRIIEIGKHMPPEDTVGESVGINRLGSDIQEVLYDTLQRRIDHENGAMEFYEAAFNDMIQRGYRFDVADVTDVPVMEIDTPEDYEEVKKAVVNRLNT